MKHKTKITLLVCIAIVLILCIIGINQGYRMFYENVYSKSGETNYIYVYKNTTFDELINLIEENNVIISKSSFLLHAKLLHFSQPKSGKYTLKAKEGNLNLIRRLRNGEQTPVKITFNNIRTKEQLAGKLNPLLMLDSVEVLELLNNADYLQKYGLNPETALCLFIPNTYEVYWNIDAPKLFDRMHKEYLNFWNDERKQLATKAGLTPVEVCILASIIEEETNNSKEKPIIAGLYINRLNIGMPLQACPTVKYALHDFTLQRVLKKHIAVESPYNTYLNRGLPPGPIRIPTAATMDAVLNYTHHKYLYMCAKETLNGEHNFASTLAEHNRNAAKYQQEINRRKIY